MALSTASSIVGIPNLGNSCFLNVVVQSLAALKPFKERLKRISQLQKEPRTAGRLADVLSAINSSREPSTKDIRYLGGPFLEHHQQQDAHEFMQYIISQVMDDERQIEKQQQTESGNFGFFGLTTRASSGLPLLIKSAEHHSSESTNNKRVLPMILKPEKDQPKRERNPFEGVLQSELRYPREKGCEHHSSITYQPFIDLSLSIGRSLQDCLEDFTTEERITGVYCESCFKENKEKKYTTATKRMLIARMPEVICFQIRRLISTEHGPRKIATPLSFPIDLDMSPYCTTTQPSSIGTMSIVRKKTTTTMTTKTTTTSSSKSSSSSSTLTSSGMSAGAAKSKMKMHKQPIVGGSSMPSSKTTTPSELNSSNNNTNTASAMTSGNNNSSNNSVITSMSATESVADMLSSFSLQAFSKMTTSLAGSTTTAQKQQQKSQIKSNSIMYRLFSVIVHEGSHNGGHYIVYRRPEDATIDSQEWYKISDKMVVPVRQEDVLSAQAYMLYYIKKDLLGNKKTLNS